jgi:hypothetical protein
MTRGDSAAPCFETVCCCERFFQYLDMNDIADTELCDKSYERKNDRPFESLPREDLLVEAAALLFWKFKKGELSDAVLFDSSLVSPGQLYKKMYRSLANVDFDANVDLFTNIPGSCFVETPCTSL